MSIKVSRLKSVLQNAIDELDNFEDDQKIVLVSNTYFLGPANYFIGISGMDGGYLDLNNMEVEEEDE